MSSVTFPVSIGGDGSTVSDDSNATTGLASGGYRTRFVPALAQIVAIASVLNTRTISLQDTSTTSVAIGLGSKSFTTAKVYNFAVGQFAVIASSASPANYLYGQVTSYNSSTGALVVNVTAVAGSGTFASWAISLSVPSGAHVAKAGDVMTGDLSIPSLNSGPLAGFRNRIINGNMDIAQRGTVFTNPANGDYTLDRWVIAYNGSGASRVVSQQTYAAGFIEDYEASSYMVFQQTAAGSGATYNVIAQRIEGVRSLAGKTVNVSFYAHFDSALSLNNVLLRQNFGSGGSASVDTVVSGVQAIGLNMAKYSFTVTLPSLSGKTIGANSFLELQIGLPINQTFTFYLSGVSVVPGSQPTPIEYRPAGLELALCQRYYATVSSTINTYGSTGWNYNLVAQLPVTMRATPVLTVGTSSPNNCTVSGVSALSSSAVQWAFMVTAVGSCFCGVTATASAEL